jgi:uncharacterized protein
MTVAEYARPVPIPDPDSAPFWEGCRGRELRGQRCAGCGLFRWPPRGVCPRCHSWESTWEVLAGDATVVSFVVVHQATSAAFADAVPYVIARLALDGTDEQMRLTSNIVDCAWEEVAVGMRATVVFEDVTDEVTLPRFRPR